MAECCGGDTNPNPIACSFLSTINVLVTVVRLQLCANLFNWNDLKVQYCNNHPKLRMLKDSLLCHLLVLFVGFCTARHRIERWRRRRGGGGGGGGGGGDGGGWRRRRRKTWFILIFALFICAIFIRYGFTKYRKRKCLRTCHDHVQKTGVSMYNEGHESYKDTWICDWCNESHDKREMMHACRVCKYDFCEGCFTGVEVQKQVPTN